MEMLKKYLGISKPVVFFPTFWWLLLDLVTLPIGGCVIRVFIMRKFPFL